MVEPDVAGEEAEDPRELEVGASLKRRLVEAPRVARLPVGVLELMLHVEEPDPGRACEQQRRALHQQERLPADEPARRPAIAMARARSVPRTLLRSLGRIPRVISRWPISSTHNGPNTNITNGLRNSR